MEHILCALTSIVGVSLSNGLAVAAQLQVTRPAVFHVLCVYLFLLQPPT